MAQSNDSSILTVTLNCDPLHYVNTTNIGLDEDIDPDTNLIHTTISPSIYYLERAFEKNVEGNNLHSNIKILHVNTRSYFKNQDFLWSYLDNIKPKFHIIAITETWTNLNNEDLLNHRGYKTYVKSRPEGRGGGVALLVDNSLQSEIHDMAFNDIDSFEGIFVQITIPGSKPVLIGSLYRPPDTNPDIFLVDLEKIMTYIDRMNKSTYICGDYNMNLLNIDTNHHTNDFLNLMSSFLFHPLILAPTRITNSSSTLIDNIFTNSFNVKEYSGILVTDLSDHLPIFTIIESKLHVTTKPKWISYRPTSDQALNSLTTALSSEDWMEPCSLENPDLILESINSKLLALYNLSYPIIVKKARIYKTKMKPWMSPALLKACRNKNKLYKHYLNTRNNIALNKYKTYKNKLTNILRKCEKQYYVNLLDLHKSNLRETWKIIKGVLNNHTTNHTNIPLRINGILVDNPVDKANEFNKYFTSIGPTLAATIPTTNHSHAKYLTNPNPNSLFLSPVTTTEVNDIILNLKNTSPLDHRELPIEIIKKIAPFITTPLTHLFNQSFITGIVPKAMKIATITPIFKSGDIHELANYRPISKLPCFSKMLERAMHNRLQQFLDKSNILYDRQFGFRKSYSTAHAIMEVVDHLTTNIDKRLITIGVFLDLSKAFDTIKHDILLDKLAHYGIRGITLDWFKSYLTERHQQVTCSNAVSNLTTILCGVPQGSILGPLLFLIYINDIIKCSNNLIMYLFADDTTVFITAANYLNLTVHMNNELIHLNDWLNVNLLSLNLKKTSYIIFSGPRKIISEDPGLPVIVNNYPIQRVSQVKFLGIIIDEHLTWLPHILLVKNKIAKIIGVIKRLKNTLPMNSLRALYNALLLPHLNYGAIVWAGGYKTPLQKILILQKKAIRIIAGLHYLAHTSKLFHKLNILNIYDLYKLQLATFMYQYHRNCLPNIFKHYFTSNAVIHNHFTRASHNLHIELSKTNIRYFSVRMAGPRLWNEIDLITRASVSIHSFKRAYKNRYLMLFDLE